MTDDEHRRRVVERIEETMRQDRTKCQVVGWTRLGLLEITRKKTRADLMSYFYETCIACKGTGRTYVR